MSAEIPQNILDSTYIWLLTQDQAKRALWYLPSNEQDAIEYVTNQVNIILDEKFKEESEILWESFTKLIMLYWWKIAWLKLLQKLWIREVRFCRWIDITTELYDLFINQWDNSVVFKKKLYNEARRVQRYIYSCYPKNEEINFLLRCSDTSADFLHLDLWWSFPTFELENNHYWKEYSWGRRKTYKKFWIKNIELNILKMLRDFEERKDHEDIEAPQSTKLAINIVQKVEQDYKWDISRISAKYENNHLKLQVSTPKTITRRNETKPNQFIEIDPDGNIQVWQSEKISIPSNLIKRYSAIEIELLDDLLKAISLPWYQETTQILESWNEQDIDNFMIQLLTKKELLFEKEKEALKHQDIDDIDWDIDDIEVEQGSYYKGKEVTKWLFTQWPMHQFIWSIESFIHHKHHFNYKNPHTIWNQKSKISLHTLMKIREMMMYVWKKLNKDIEMEFLCAANDLSDDLCPVQLKHVQDRNFPVMHHGNEHKTDNQELIGKSPFVFGNFDITCRIMSCYKNDYNFLRVWEKVAIKWQSWARFFYNDFEDFWLTVATDHGIILAHDIDYIPIHKKWRREYRSIWIPNSDLKIEWEDAKSTANGRNVWYKISKDYYTFKSDWENWEVWINKKDI